MGPHPEAPVDVQKYIGSCLISQQPRSKRKSCPRQCEKGGRGHNGYGGVSPPLPICNCCGGVDIKKVGGYPKLNNYAWTGMPLISVANTRQKNPHGGSKHKIIPQYKPPDRERLVDYVPRVESPDCCQTGGNVVNLEDILPISRLAIHAQGAPLIITSGDCEKVDGNGQDIRHDVDGYLLPRRDVFWGNNTSGSPPMYMIMSGSPIEMTTPGSYIQDDEVSVSGDSDMVSRQMSPLQSDCVSTTSEDSITSENGLPRIIKPRKRRKKDRRISEGEQEPVFNNDMDEVHGTGTIVTLKPYKPLCYRYAENPANNPFAVASSPPKEFICDTLNPPPSSKPASKMTVSQYPYPSSPFCRCPYCVPPPSTLLTPPDSPVNVSGDYMRRIRELQSSVCEVSTKIVNSPMGCRDLEIKFLSSSSDDDASSMDDVTSGRIHAMQQSSGPTLVLTSAHPPQRPWIQLSEHNSSLSSCTFTVMCYNILCDKYATRQMYGYCPNWALEWAYRRKNIMHEIRHYKADILSLQEVETEQFYNFFLPELKADGYDGIFSPKSRAKTMTENEKKHVDGCAIFFKTNKFNLIKEHLVEFNQLAMANARNSDDMLNRVMTKDNIGLAALLQTKPGAYDNGTDLAQSNQTLLVCTAHIHWDPDYSDVKLIQTMMLMNEMQLLVKDTLQNSVNPSVQKNDLNSIPLVLCGDFNSLPDSGVIEFLSSGRVSTSHCDFKEFVYEQCLRKIGNTNMKSKEFTHPFKISRAYGDEIMPFTNYSHDFKGVIDYVYSSKMHLSVLGVLGPVDSKWLQENRVVGCPHPHVPSDHFPILAELQLTPTVSTHPPLPNGVTLHR